MKYALTNCHIFSGEHSWLNHAVVIDNDKIDSIILATELSEEIPSIDLNGNILSPGLIDLQLNGCGGVMFNDDISLACLTTMHQTNLKSGCTSFLPTLISSSDEDMRRAIATVREYCQQHANQVLGLHLEGPYLSLAKKGIHNSNYIREASDEMIAYICQNSDVVKMVTVAPEQVMPSHIQKLADAGIVVAIGHSNANYQEASASFKSGVTFATHLFNAMSPITGRDPGVVGAVFDNDSIYAGIIADGYHVDYANIRISQRLKRGKLILVTDATAPAGAQIDSFQFVGKTVYYRDGQCVDENGTLGGSALTMIKALENISLHADIQLSEAIRMGTIYPANAIGISNEIGQIKHGMTANLIIFDPKFNIQATVVNGHYEQNIQ
jgi:N-acetylglucosamine-6-phosphate deacetylase